MAGTLGLLAGAAAVRKWPRFCGHGRLTESPSSSIRPVAGIDIGTNSIHLLIAQVDTALRSFSVLLTEKSTTSICNRRGRWRINQVAKSSRNAIRKIINS